MSLRWILHQTTKCSNLACSSYENERCDVKENARFSGRDKAAAQARTISKEIAKTLAVIITVHKVGWMVEDRREDLFPTYERERTSSISDNRRGVKQIQSKKGQTRSNQK